MSGVLSAVRDAVELTAYPEILAAFSPSDVRPAAWVAARAVLPPSEGALLSFLLLGDRVPLAALPCSLAEVVPTLVAVGVCNVDPDGARLNGLMLVDVGGIWVLAQQPQLAPTMYFGDDSLALARHVRPRSGGRALDLCSGPGTQALLASLWSAEVVAVEINPVVAALAAVNVALNDRATVVSVRQGDLYAPVDGERFDTIIANPPLLPIPADLPYPFVGAGGVEGLDVVWRILAGAAGHLADAGTLHLLGTTLSDGLLPVAVERLEDVCRSTGLDVDLTITAHLPLGPGSWWSQGVGSTIAAVSGQAVAETVQQLDDGYRAAGGSHICAYFLRARQGAGALRLLDVSTGVSGTFWYV